MNNSTPKPAWFLSLEKDAEAVKSADRLALAIDATSKLPPANHDHDYSDCIGTWNRGQARLKLEQRQ